MTHTRNNHNRDTNREHSIDSNGFEPDTSLRLFLASGAACVQFWDLCHDESANETSQNIKNTLSDCWLHGWGLCWWLFHSQSFRYVYYLCFVRAISRCVYHLCFVRMDL